MSPSIRGLALTTVVSLWVFYSSPPTEMAIHIHKRSQIYPLIKLFRCSNLFIVKCTCIVAGWSWNQVQYRSHSLEQCSESKNMHRSQVRLILMREKQINLFIQAGVQEVFGSCPKAQQVSGKCDKPVISFLQNLINSLCHKSINTPQN